MKPITLDEELEHVKRTLARLRSEHEILKLRESCLWNRWWAKGLEGFPWSGRNPFRNKKEEGRQ